MYDVVVVGGGVMGLATSWYLVHKANKTVLLLDQFSFPTTRNSSNGQSRIYRRSYEEDHYSAMMEKAIPLWHELERLLQTKIIYECGLLYGGHRDVVKSVKNVMKKSSAAHEIFTFKELHHKWPQIEGFHTDAEFVYEPNAGFIAAAEAMGAYHTLLTRTKNFTFLPRTTVLSIQPLQDSDVVRVITDQEVHIGKAMVLTPGPWAGRILDQIKCPLPLVPQKVAVAYFKTNNKQLDSYEYQNLPTVIIDKKVNNIYWIPEYEYRGMIKIGNHHGVPMDPDSRDSDPLALKSIIDPMVNFVANHLPSLDSQPAIIEHCTYCCTPDHTYIIDRHPQYRNIVIGTGFSGHGFKMAPIVGETLGKLCLEIKPDIDISPFSVRRFKLISKL